MKVGKADVAITRWVYAHRSRNSEFFQKACQTRECECTQTQTNKHGSIRFYNRNNHRPPPVLALSTWQTQPFIHQPRQYVSVLNLTQLACSSLTPSRLTQSPNSDIDTDSLQTDHEAETLSQDGNHAQVDDSVAPQEHADAHGQGDEVTGLHASTGVSKHVEVTDSNRGTLDTPRNDTKPSEGPTTPSKTASTKGAMEKAVSPSQSVRKVGFQHYRL